MVRSQRQGKFGASQCSGKSADTTRLAQVAKETESSLLPPSITELIQHFDGDKYRTAYELTREDLGSTGNIEEYQRQYKNYLGDINRYLKRTRTPNARMKERFKRLYTPNPSKSLKVRLRGCVRVSDDYYYKDTTWNNPIEIPANEVKEFLQLAQDNVQAGYGVLLNHWRGNQRSAGFRDTFQWLDNVQIQMGF
jgi:hypothetical protein